MPKVFLIFLISFFQFPLHAESNGFQVARGLNYYCLKNQKFDGPLVIHILMMDLSNPQRKIKIVLAGDKSNERNTLTAICRSAKPLAAVNGTYFGKETGTLGILMSNRELLSVPLKSRTAFGITADRREIWGNPVFKGMVEFRESGRSYSLDGINQCTSRSQLVLYTHDFGTFTPVQPGCREFVILRDTVFGLGEGGSLIPPGGYVLGAYGDYAESLKSVSLLEHVKVMSGLDYRWSFAEYAIGGGPRLLRDGKLCPFEDREQFQNDILVGRAPRTALGTIDNKIVMVVIDGRQPDYSIGVTLEELAEIMLNLGCKNALNLDGGGSATIVVNNQLMNRPSDGRERPINNALLLY
ncbi:MAG: phosphodiester glycosidase family protein [Candidatus Wallbacteria bacterium]|nr:phosphodiester glycosidase family protein [Candidatus Wallbacteria bacterium]